MKRARFSEEQIIAMLKKQGRRTASTGSTADLCRKDGVSSATFYNWTARYGGLDVSNAQRLKALEEENRKLKKLLVEARLGIRS